jgi:bacterioferritin (cytochrome b1)
LTDRHKLAKGTVSELVKRLNKALRLEYSLIIHYPHIANLIRDQEVKKLTTELGGASIHHADVVASIISELGGKPEWSFDPFPEGNDIKKIFRIQLSKERAALQLHKGSAEMFPPNAHSEALSALAKEEEQHIQIVEVILSKLSPK